MQEQELRMLVKQWVKAQTRLPDAKQLDIGDDTDLLRAGLLDSLGFVELLSYVEDVTGVQVDLSDADPSEFTTVAGFCRFALRQPS